MLPKPDSRKASHDLGGEWTCAGQDDLLIALGDLPGDVYWWVTWEYGGHDRRDLIPINPEVTHSHDELKVLLATAFLFDGSRGRDITLMGFEYVGKINND